jgi:2-oxoglutarate ferredoxin oxidoreductase subunit gamma
MKERLEIVASGFGGQGVVRLGQVLGEAAVKQGLRVTMLKSHGTEMRGGYVRSQVVMSKKAIDSPICENPDFFIALSSSAYDRFKDIVPDRGLILYDPQFVKSIDDNLSCKHKELPAKQLAIDNFGKAIFSNTIALGAMARLLDGDIEKDVILKSILEVIPKFHEENRDAFEIGYTFMH